MVVTLGPVATLIRGDVYHWGGLMTRALVAAAPSGLIYAFLMDHHIAGATAGAGAPSRRAGPRRSRAA